MKNNNIMSSFRVKQLLNKKGKIGVALLKKFEIPDFSRVIKELSTLPFYKGIIAENPFPKELKQLGKNSYYGKADTIEAELSWHAAILSMFTEELTRFMENKSEFERFLLLGKYAEANVTIMNIEKTFGQSLWLIENKINLLELTEGTEAQKDYLKSITKNDDILIFVKIFSNFFSIRGEKSYPSDMYRKNLRDLILTSPNHIKDFIHDISFRLDLFEENRIYDYCGLLSRTSNYSMIDRLLIYIRVSQYLLSFDPNTNNIASVKRSMELLGTDFGNNLLHNISIYCGLNYDLKSDRRELEQIINMLDLYTKGNYDKVLLEYQALYEQLPDRLEMTVSYIKSIINVGHPLPEEENKTLLFNITENIFNIITKNDQSHDSYLSLQKMIDTYTSCDWSYQLQFILCTEYYSNQYEFAARKFIKIGLLNSTPYNPYNILYCNEETKESISKFLMINFPNSLTVKLLLNVYENNLANIQSLDIPDYRKDRFISQLLLSQGFLDEAYPIIIKYFALDNLFVKQNFIANLLNYYIKKGDYNLAIEFVVDTYFQNPNMHVRMPIEELLNKIEIEREANLQDNICLPILYEIYSRNINKSKDFYISESYEDYLLSHGLERPSELAKKSDLDVRKLIYFLDNVCVQHIMDSSVVFNSTDDIDRERIAICQLLKEIDQDNVTKYSEEIKNITHRLTIKQGIREIEESKIYVDVEGIKKSFQNTLKEKYFKFLSMVNKEQETETIDLFADEIKNLVGFEQNEFPMIRLSRGRMMALLSLILEVRNHFVSSNEYGLDGYLSNGIRHGTIQGQLRSPLEKLNLITQKDSETNVYRANEYWIKRLKNCDTAIMEAISELLAQFSREIDEIIDYLKNKLIQIRLENKNPNGIFDYQVYSNEFEYLYWEIVTNNLNFDEFLEYIFSYLWRKTDVNLTEIRNTINGKIKQEINTKFDVLMKDIEQLKSKREFIDENALGDLTYAIIEAKTAIQYELNNVENWFKRSKTSTYSDYDIGLPIEIATKVINNIYPNHTFNPSTHFTNTVLLKGKTLKSFVDIYFTLFDNIIKHCSTTKFSPVVEVVVKVVDFKLEITVLNELPEQLDVETLKEKLIEINESLLTIRSHDRVSKEGGTGFYKINKIISVDLDCGRKISLSNIDNKFQVELTIDAWRLIK